MKSSQRNIRGSLIQSREEKAHTCHAVWLASIQSATAVLRQQRTTTTKPPSLLEINRGLEYLESMATSLQELENYWNQPPLRLPPKFRDAAGATKNKRYHPTAEAPMVMRRILIRVLTSQSEMLAFKASQYRFTKPIPLWKLGANTYSESLAKIHAALQLADSECARLLATMEESTMEQNSLTEDAQIVEVSIQYLTQGRDKFRESACKHANRLRRALEPQWTARDGARQRVGEDKWNNNPAPKNSFKKLREDDEKELREIEAVIQQLDDMDVPQGEAVRGHFETQSPKQRYNGERTWDLSRRLPFDAFPDPIEFGWTFTGSWNNTVEFFERKEEDGSIVKLDWYFTTGTLKTSLHHPFQGKTQMFAAQVDPVTYVEILINPRVHTDVRYKTKEAKNHLVKKPYY